MHLEIIFKDPNRKKIFLSKTKTLCAVILSYHLLTWFTGCPFRFFFGISCPGCGMPRALLAALRLDFAAAFSYHPLFFLLPFFLLAMYEKNGQPLEKIQLDTERDNYMSALQAKEYGLIDEVIAHR